MNLQKDSSLINQEWEVDVDMLDAPMMESTVEKGMDGLDLQNYYFVSF